MIDVHHYNLGLQLYQDTHEAMRNRIVELKSGQLAELWSVEHPPVFTQGQAGKSEHIFEPGCIPIVQSDRGGQVTYHGPGQLVVYTLVPLNAFGLNVRDLIRLLETSVIDVLREFGIQGERRLNAPGVFVGKQKIASLGLRIRQGVAYHGVALNVAMDLDPFSRINPCGYENLEVTQMADHISCEIAHTRKRLCELLKKYLRGSATSIDP